jgi:hypothetical protein
MSQLQEASLNFTVKFCSDLSNYLQTVHDVTLGSKTFEIFCSYHQNKGDDAGMSSGVWVAVRLKNLETAYFSLLGDIICEGDPCSCVSFATRKSDMRRLRASDYSCHIRDYFARFPDGGSANVKMSLKLFGGPPPPTKIVRAEPFTLEEHMESWLRKGDGDVTFIVGPERVHIRAHSSFIRHSIAIPIIHESMLEGASKEIVLPDIDPAVFRAFLVFIYTGRVQHWQLTQHALALLALGDRSSFDPLPACDGIPHAAID